MIGDLLTSAAPLILAGTGALLTELSGAIAVFMEGFINLGAFVAWTVTKGVVQAGGPLASSPWIPTALACLAACLVGAALAWALARFVAASGANPFIAGLAINLAVSGGTDALSAVLHHVKGILSSPSVQAVKPIGGVSPFVYLALAVALCVGFWINATKGGLRLRASGAAPEALRERGVDPHKQRVTAWTAAGALGSLAGAALMFRVGAYVPGGASGKGWIALVLVYLGMKRTGGVVVAALIFALADRLSVAAQGNASIPPTLLLSIPYLIALTLFTIYSRLFSMPKNTGAKPPSSRK